MIHIEREANEVAGHGHPRQYLRRHVFGYPRRRQAAPEPGCSAGAAGYRWLEGRGEVYPVRFPRFPGLIWVMLYVADANELEGTSLTLLAVVARSRRSNPVVL